jgi:hypothetical protein
MQASRELDVIIIRGEEDTDRVERETVDGFLRVD